MITAVVLLSISLSIDALSMGVSYGMQKVKIPLLPKILICFSSVIYALMGLVSGGWLFYVLGHKTANIIGVIILVLIGTWMIHKAYKGNARRNGSYMPNEQGKLAEFAIKSIGITIMVIKNPAEGDIDNSGVIDIKEALLLGIALNMDAAAACMGSVMIGLSSWMIPLFVGAVQMLFIEGGLWLGKAIHNRSAFSEKILSIVPGLILISMGLARLIV